MQCSNACPLYPPIATAKADMRKSSCLLYPRKRKCAVQPWMSALGQKRTSRQPQWQHGPPLSSSATQHTAEMCQKGHSLACHATADRCSASDLQELRQREHEVIASFGLVTLKASLEVGAGPESTVGFEGRIFPFAIA